MALMNNAVEKPLRRKKYSRPVVKSEEILAPALLASGVCDPEIFPDGCPTN